MKTKPKSSPSVVVFDFDGTLVDTMSFLTETAVDIMIRNYALPLEIARVKYIQTTGLPFAVQIQEIFPDHKNNAKTIEEFESCKAKSYLAFSPFPGTREVLSSLSSYGCGIAISSSTNCALLSKYLSHYHLEADLLLGYEPGFHKGEPHFAHVANHFSVTKHAIIYVGDSLNDLMLAKANHVTFVGKIGLFSEADFRALDPSTLVIKQLTEILDLLFLR